jgi:hypothetical protein
LCGVMGLWTGDGSRTTGFQRSPASPFKQAEERGHVIQCRAMLCSCKSMLSIELASSVGTTNHQFNQVTLRDFSLKIFNRTQTTKDATGILQTFGSCSRHKICARISWASAGKAIAYSAK